jgi:hypothetical protein
LSSTKPQKALKIKKAQCIVVLSLILTSFHHLFISSFIHFGHPAAARRRYVARLAVRSALVSRPDWAALLRSGPAGHRSTSLVRGYKNINILFI